MVAFVMKLTLNYDVPVSAALFGEPSFQLHVVISSAVVSAFVPLVGAFGEFPTLALLAVVGLALLLPIEMFNTHLEKNAPSQESLKYLNYFFMRLTLISLKVVVLVYWYLAVVRQIPALQNMWVDHNYLVNGICLVLIVMNSLFLDRSDSFGNKTQKVFITLAAVSVAAALAPPILMVYLVFMRVFSSLIQRMPTATRTKNGEAHAFKAVRQTR